MPEVPSVSRVAELSDASSAAFASDGPLARVLEGYEPRPAQLEMAAAVASVLSSRGVLLVEAGTGTGKTLAYLVPAILSRQRVLVSTGTKNLQEQIFFKDLPVLREALGVPFTATCMKGRGNYLCLHRFEAFRESPAIRSFDETTQLRILEHWVQDTETGDRAEVDDLPEDLPFWNDIAATTENCIGAECPRYADCFVVRMRQRAAESDVVIVNHHLLCADAAVRQSTFGEVIPRCGTAIVDEAHQLEDVATQYFGLSVSNYRLDELARDVDRATSAGLVADAERRLEMVQDAQRIRQDARLLFSAVHMIRFDVPNARGAESRVRVKPSDLARVAEEGAAVVSALEALEADVALAKDVPEDVIALGRRASEIRDDLKFLLRANDPGYVFFLETRGRGTFLRASPIDVSSTIRDLLIDRMDATVLTSATLTVDDSFDYVRGRLGVTRATELKLDSEFDYRRQSILYLPRRIPDPRQPDFVAAAAREIVSILQRTSGRAFVLFTSYANLREVHRLASTELEFPILVQGTAPRSALLRDFKATPNAVLLATSSFWQGVDVVGEALSCVIIDKLPFASPGDPITAARVEAIGARGGSAFGEYQIPLAILALKQGLGRLLRHRQDRGVLAVLDPRLKTMGYGRRFLASLPPAPVTQDLGDIARFFDAATDDA
ncbi:MAG TPA: ATP-dependent DNA helicase [Vicinamibacterales bacterium]